VDEIEVVYFRFTPHLLK